MRMMKKKRNEEASENQKSRKSRKQKSHRGLKSNPQTGEGNQENGGQRRAKSRG